MTKYTKNHEWIRLEHADQAVVGITNYAQEQLGELVYVELPEVDRKYLKDEPNGVVESTKTASDIYAPLDCYIMAVNSAVEDQPEMVNSGPEGEGWLYRVQIMDMAQLDELLDEEEI